MTSVVQQRAAVGRPTVPRFSELLIMASQLLRSAAFCKDDGYKKWRQIVAYNDVCAEAELYKNCSDRQTSRHRRPFTTSLLLAVLRKCHVLCSLRSNYLPHGYGT